LDHGRDPRSDWSSFSPRGMLREKSLQISQFASAEWSSLTPDLRIKDCRATYAVGMFQFIIVVEAAR
jgi:hypothetical protein